VVEAIGDRREEPGGWRRTQRRESPVPYLPAPVGSTCFSGYSIMLESWDLENELATTGYIGDPAELNPYQLLTGLAEGNGGHLAPLLATP
jgi:hypothetical protein